MPCTSRPARPAAVTATGSGGSTRRRPAICSATTGPRSAEPRADRPGPGRACDRPCRGCRDEVAARHSGRNPCRTCADVDKTAVCRRVIDCWRPLHNDWVTGPVGRVSGSTVGDRAGPSVPACPRHFPSRDGHLEERSACTRPVYWPPIRRPRSSRSPQRATPGWPVCWSCSRVRSLRRGSPPRSVVPERGSARMRRSGPGVRPRGALVRRGPGVPGDNSSARRPAGPMTAETFGRVASPEVQ
jgi:hypothetical protein